MSIPLDKIPEPARAAWAELRDRLMAMLDDDLVAVWAYGGTTASGGRWRPADLDTYVVLRRAPDASTARRIDDAESAIGEAAGVEFDTWYVLEASARRRESPRHAYRPERLDTTWAVNRAHWLAGRYVNLCGAEPAAVVPTPDWSELQVDLDREVEHLEAHVAAGDTDAFEATYALLNGSRVLRAVETRDVAISKREAGAWALEHLPDRWHPPLRAALRSHEGHATPADVELLASEMGAFVAMVRGRSPGVTPRPEGAAPRWSGS